MVAVEVDEADSGGAVVAVMRDGAASVKIAEVEVAGKVQDEAMELRLVVANKPSRSSRKMEPHAARL